jgi:VWFA-related protein
MKKTLWRKRLVFLALLVFVGVSVLAQNKAQKPGDDQVIRISTELVQLDVVVTDKNGRVVKNLTKDDFTINEAGKKQQINFFEFVDAAGGKIATTATPEEQKRQGLTEADVRRIFAFVIDDLTLRNEDLNNLRQMLIDFVDNRMQANDLVAIIRTLGGNGLLQQYTSDKELLHRAIASITATTNPYSAFHNPEVEKLRDFVASTAGTSASVAGGTGAVDISGETIDIDSPFDEDIKATRALMALGTSSFIIDGLKQLPGRKTMVLISGGFPIFSMKPSEASNTIANYFQGLIDKATRSGVAINTLDIGGLQIQGIASFEDTPAKSSLGGGSSAGFGRRPDTALLGDPVDTFANQQGLRALAADTGGIAVLNRNNFRDGLDKILNTSEAYYILAYTPSDQNFKGDFRKLEVKVKGDYKVYSRRGYLAREDKSAGAAPATKQEQILTAIKSPLAKRDIDLDAMLMYKAADAPNKGALEINLVIDPKKLNFEQEGDKRKADFDIVGFVFDELGKLRGGFSETVMTALSPAEYDRIAMGGFTYSANTTIPSGIYQVRLAVRDNKTGKMGTLSRFLEVPNLTKGRLSASTLMLGAVGVNDMKAPPVPLSGNRQISRKQDMRYAVLIYNAKTQDKKPQIKTQLAISQYGKIIFQEPEEMLAATSPNGLIKIGQIGMGVKPGRYTLTLIITDTLADKKAQTITRSMDFVVVN